MWLLIVFLLNPDEFPNQPASIVLAVKPTKELCEQFKIGVLASTIRQYNLTYPLNFRLECKEEKP